MHPSSDRPSPTGLVRQPALSNPELEELQTVQQKLKNMGKTAQSKSKALQDLHPDLSKNKLLVEPGTTHPNKSKDSGLLDIVQPTERPPVTLASIASASTQGQATDGFEVETLKSNVIQALSSAMDPPTVMVQDDQGTRPELSGTAAVAILESIYGTGIPVFRRLGGTFTEFVKEFDKRKREWLDRVARGEVREDGSLPMPPDQATKQEEAIKKPENMTIDEIKSAMTGETTSPSPGEQQPQTPDQASSSKTKGGHKRRASTGSASTATATKKAAMANGSVLNASGSISTPIPSKFSKRYQSGTLPLYSQTGSGALVVPSATNGSDQPPNPNPIDFGTRYLQLRIPSYKTPDYAFKYYCAMYVKGVDLTFEKYMTGDIKARQPTLMRWADIQENAFVEARNDEEACMLGLGCIGRQLRHPSGSFTFRRWRDPDHRGKKHRPKKDPCLCYADMLLYLNLVKDYERRTGLCSAGLDSPFLYLIGVPGEYNASAFRECVEGNNEATTRRIRHLVLSQLQPARPISVDSKIAGAAPQFLRRFVERPSLQCRDGSQKISQLAFVNPSSYLDTEIETMTNERILLTYVFRDMAQRYKQTLGQELPERFKVCRLAFIPFEEGLVLFNSTDFRQQYLPKDFMTNADYILKHFDILTLCKDQHGNANTSIKRPILEGHSIFWLMHIRLNAALALLENGLDSFIQALVAGSNGSQKEAATLPGSSTGSKPPVNVTLPKSAQLPTTDASEPRVWISSNDLRETLQNESEGIRAKLTEYVKCHSSLVEYFLAQLNKRQPIHDDSILPDGGSNDAATDLWASIKPRSNYLGPFFPEDRRYIEYIQRPRVVIATPPGQMAHHYLNRWCASIPPSSSPTTADQHLLVHCLTSIKSNKLTWRTLVPPPQVPDQDLGLRFTLPGSGGKRSIDMKVILGDLDGLIWWLQNEASTEQRTCLYNDCERFEKAGWNYKAHPSVVRALSDGSWWTADRIPNKNHYVILMAVLVAVYCATVTMETLSKLYDIRQARFGEKLSLVNIERSRMLSNIVADSSAKKDPYTYEPPKQCTIPTSLAVDGPREKLYHLHESMRTLEETIFQLQKFIHSHLPLAHAMLVHCSDAKGSGPSDAAVMDSNKTGSGVFGGNWNASLFQVYHPFGGARVMSEDMLIDCATRESFVKFIADSSNKEPLLDGQQKAMPVRCHTRDYVKKTERIVFSNAAYSRYCLMNLYCSLVGGYRSARVKPRFERCLEVYNQFKDLDRLDLNDMNQFLRKHKFIALNTLRENTVFHIRTNEAFHQAVIMSFDGYRGFEDKWLQECMDTTRSMFDKGMTMQAIDNRICELYGKNTPFVYRRLKTDFYRYSWNRLKDVLCKRVVQHFMQDDQFEWPDVLTIEKESLRYLIHIVKQLDPHSDSFNYAEVLEKLGCSKQTTTLIQTIEAMFARDGQISAMETLLETLSEEEHLLAFAFFHLLRCRASIRLLDLTAAETEAQVEAITRRTGVCESELPPISSGMINFCSIAACNKRKTPVVQERGNKYYG